MSKVFKITFSLLFILTLFTVDGIAQTKKKKQSVRDSLRAAIETRDSVILSFKKSDTSINGLLQKVESYTSSFNAIKASLTRGFDTVEISQQLPLFEKRIVTIKTLIDNDKSGTLRYLYAIRDFLTHSDDQLDIWQSELNEINSRLEEAKNELNTIARDSTFNVMPVDSALQRIYLLQKNAIQSKRLKLEALNKKLLVKTGLMQNRVTSAYISILDEKDQIDIKIREFSIRAISSEFSNIWEMKASEGSSFNTALSRTINMNQQLFSFILSREIIIHIAGTLLFILFLVWILSNRAKILRVKEKPEDVLNQTHYLAKYPLVSVILITFAIVPNFYDHPPVVFLQAFFVVLITMILILVNKTCPKPLFNYLRLLFFITIVYSVSNLFIEATNADRIIILLLSAATVIISLRFLWQVKKNRDRFFPYSVAILRVFIFLQVTTFLLNAFGRFSLSKIIGITAVYNLWLALGLYFLVQIIMEALFLQLEANKNNSSLSSLIDFKLLQNKFRSVLNIVAVILWLIMLSQNLNIEDAADAYIDTFLSNPHKLAGTGSQFTFQSIIIFIGVIWISSVIAKVISYLYDVSGHAAGDITLLKKKNRTSTLLIKIAVFSIGFLLAVTASGFPLDKITIIISAFGIGIGFGLQNIVNNLVSGLILAFEKPIQIGDIIEVDNRSGTIMEIGIRSSKIATSDGAEVIIPNGDLISHHVINWTLSNNNRRIELIIGVAYGSDIEKVKTLLTDLLGNNEDIMDNPAPLIFVHNLNENSVDFRLLFWAADINTWLSLKSSILTDIYIAFAKAGIKIPIPQRDLRLRLTNEQANIIANKKKKPGETTKVTNTDITDTGLPDANPGPVAPDQ